MDAGLLATLALLIGLELVLGIDNILVITIMVSRLPEEMRQKARIFGLVLAMVARLVMLFVILALASMEDPIIGKFSVRDLILMVGGMFLLYKAVTEIHHMVELKEEDHSNKSVSSKFTSAIVQIILLDIVFSVDSVLTAVGLTRELWVIITAVIVSFATILMFAKQVGEFIMNNPALKILALAFLVTIGTTIFLEGIHQHVEKAYIYLPMGFALGIQLLQMRYHANRKKRGLDAEA
ncbi:MAG: TerC family protein [Opitutales bacterium]|jgi:predicted tellurium resistance membrane protein TerC|nr:TerC family protein [Opitutales bacterium]